MAAAMDDTASRTIDELERRLGHIRYMVAGYFDADNELGEVQKGGPQRTVAARMDALEQALSGLCKKSRAVHDVLAVVDRHPDLVGPAEPRPATTGSLGPEHLLATVTARATLYPAVSSGLTSVLDTPVPPARASVELMALQPKIEGVDVVLERQAQEIAELRERTATLVWRWHSIQALRGQECWLEWNERLSQVAQGVRRLERARAGG
ncbi:MAG: hypothetical protein M1832_005711 [Thelocarpon impressellum]|nr:MAG: hypothetical protein M1832_005711 [Thelocarpon impressellum]